MKILRFGRLIPSREECGCGLEHDRTLKAAVIAPLEEGVGFLSKVGVEAPYAVFYDPITYSVAGKRLLELLEGEGFLVGSPTFEEAEEKVSTLRKYRTVIGVGGGTVIDVAKYAAYKSGKTFVSVPTAPSHDGIASPTTSLFDSGRRLSVKTRAPIIALIDLEVVGAAPQRLKSSGYGDIVAKIVSIKDWQLGRDEVGEAYCETAEGYTLRAVGLVVSALKKAMDERRRMEALVEALVYSGVAMMVAGSSRPASGSEHLFSHYLDMKLKQRTPHGTQCALGAIAMAYYHELHNPGWWGEPEYSWRGVKELVERAGIRASLRQNGIPVEHAVHAMVEAPEIRPNRYTILHKRRPTIEEALRIFRETGLV